MTFVVALGDGFGDYRLTAAQWQELRRNVLIRDNFLCSYCDRPADSVDHVVPRIQGGLTVPDNLIAACRSCNSRKGGRL